jgi:hypothetical protein
LRHFGTEDLLPVAARALQSRGSHGREGVKSLLRAGAALWYLEDG